MDNQEVVSSAKTEVISTGEWILYVFLLSIPLVNLILLFVWAFGNPSNQTKANFGKAGLIWIVILIVIYIIIGLIFGAFYPNEMNSGMGM